MNTESQFKSRQFARDGTHEKVLELAAALPRGSLLDAPAGSGALSLEFKELGFDVTCCDLSDKYFSVEGMTLEKVDLNEPLPYKDGQFSVVNCVEAIEHFENPWNAIREFGRILAPGGHLIMTTPNLLNVETRLRFLFSGSFEKPVAQGYLRNAITEHATMLHRTLLTYPHLRFMLESYGFEILSVAKDSIKKNQRFLFPVTWFLKFVTLFWGKEGRKRYWIQDVQSENVLTGGNTLILLVQKKALPGTVGYKAHCLNNLNG